MISNDPSSCQTFQPKSSQTTAIMHSRSLLISFILSQWVWLMMIQAPLDFMFHVVIGGCAGLDGMPTRSQLKTGSSDAQLFSQNPYRQQQ
jgi:hypothetical protein